MTQHGLLKSGFFGGILVLTGMSLNGCSLFQDMVEQDNIAQYGEAVFRKQNEITSQIMMLSEAELSKEQYQKLQQAESQMQKNCQLLNEYASREMDKSSIDLVFKKRVRDSIENCDLSIQQIEHTLIELGINE
jgi:hypothetical protein